MLIELHEEMGELDTAAEYQHQLIDLNRRVRGDGHPATVTSIHQLAVLLRRTGRYEEARPHFQEALDGRRSIFGETHSATFSAAIHKASVLHELGHLSEAMGYLREVRDARELEAGAEKRLTESNAMALLLLLEQKPSKSIDIFTDIHERLLELEREMPAAEVQRHLAAAMLASGQYDSAQQQAEELLERLERNPYPMPWLRADAQRILERRFVTTR